MSVDGASFASGRWFLADGRAHQLHVLDSAGQHLRSIGRRGRGPGEFTVPQRVAASARHIYVAELTRPEISVFDSAGKFLHYLRVKGACAGGKVEAMAALEADLYLLRRCMELPARIRYQVERSLAGGPLQPWTSIADTVHIPPGQPVPLHTPLFAAREGRLILGEGSVGCFRVFRLPEGQPAGRRCLHEVPRRPLPQAERERLTKQFRDRLAVPDSLPRVVTAIILDSTIIVQTMQTSTTASWLELPWTAQPHKRVRTLGGPHAAQSYLSGRMQLIVREEASGVRIEVVRIER